METSYDVIVVGGGAAGMMAAGKAASQGRRVLLLEKNKALGEKIKISGGGRCNITNATYDVRALLANYGKAADFLYSPFSQFGVAETFSFFESLGLPLVVQANNRAFPKTEKAIDVVKKLTLYMKRGGVEVKTGAAVEKILSEPGKITGVVVGGTTYTAENYIFATGGVSHPETGSTGDGFGWLRDLGHNVKAPTPTIVPLKTTDAWGHTISGITIPDAKITFFLNRKKQFSKTGNILFTHFGLSGPVILNSAGTVADLLDFGTVTAFIDLYPLLDISQLDKQVILAFEKHKNKILRNAIAEIVPPGAAAGIIMLLDGVSLNSKVARVTKEDRRKLVQVLKNLPLTITGLMGFDRAVIADGGVPLQEIDTKTMRSKVCSNLFVTGDLLHINRPSGGYSLQLCWTTGWVAGKSI